jgi:hypothetical protein
MHDDQDRSSSVARVVLAGSNDPSDNADERHLANGEAYSRLAAGSLLAPQAERPQELASLGHAATWG